MKRFFRILLSSLIVLASLSLLAAYLWLRQQHPAYTKDFYIAHGWADSEESVLARIDLANYQNHSLNPGISHRRIRLNQSGDWEIPTEILGHLPHGQSLLLSLECWGSRYWPVYRSAPLGAVSEGVYDSKIQALARILAQEDRVVYLRFNPQMEVPGRFYPWQEYPSVYIEAYQHVWQIVKSIAPKVQLVWGPAGYPGLEEYYPGDDYVDALSINLIGDSETINTVYPKQDAPTELRRRLHRLRFFKKPCLVLSGVAEPISKADLEAVADYQKANPQLYGPQYFAQKTKVKASDSLQIGVYDPDQKMEKLPKLHCEHVFINLATYAKEGFWEAYARIKAGKRDLMITLETIEDRNFERDDACLERFLAGEYDRELNTLLDSLKLFPRGLYLRFSQEMEIPISRYPWQSKEPKLYIDAYRYLMTRADTAIPGVKKIWGPAGDRGSLEWYPGGDVVDYISIAIYGLPDKNITDPTLQERFAAIYRRKSWRMRQAEKPIFITEFGVKGPEDFQKTWLLEAAETIRTAPELHGICYFNMHDVPQAWGDIAPPDWSVEPSTFEQFIAALGL